MNELGLANNQLLLVYIIFLTDRMPFYCLNVLVVETVEQFRIANRATIAMRKVNKSSTLTLSL